MGDCIHEAKHCVGSFLFGNGEALINRKDPDEMRVNLMAPNERQGSIDIRGEFGEKYMGKYYFNGGLHVMAFGQKFKITTVLKETKQNGTVRMGYFQTIRLPLSEFYIAGKPI